MTVNMLFDKTIGFVECFSQILIFTNSIINMHNFLSNMFMKYFFNRKRE